LILIKLFKIVKHFLGFIFIEGWNMDTSKLANYRHGDLALIGVGSIPEGLSESDTDVLMQGSSSNGNDDHCFKNGKVFFKKVDDWVIGYLQLFGGAKLFHREHGEKVQGGKLRQVSVQEGYYELRRQNEETHEGMQPVID
jgi:hypothetical protein